MKDPGLRWQKSPLFFRPVRKIYPSSDQNSQNRWPVIFYIVLSTAFESKQLTNFHLILSCFLFFFFYTLLIGQRFRVKDDAWNVESHFYSRKSRQRELATQSSRWRNSKNVQPAYSEECTRGKQQTCIILFDQFSIFIELCLLRFTDSLVSKTKASLCSIVAACRPMCHLVSGQHQHYHLNPTLWTKNGIPYMTFPIQLHHCLPDHHCHHPDLQGDSQVCKLTAF